MENRTEIRRRGEGGDCAIMLNWPDPTPAMLASPEFEAVWQLIKRWDIIEIVLREPIPGLGGAIMFMAPVRLFWGSEPPLMDLLERLSQEAVDSGEASGA